MLRTLLIVPWIILTAAAWVAVMLASLPFAKEKQKHFCTLTNLWNKFITRSIGIKISVWGAENLPKAGTILLVSNHESLADIFILQAAIPLPFRFLAKQVLFKIPFLGFCMRMRGDIPIVREDREKALKTLDQVAQLLNLGIPVHIFPEGTRTHTGKMRDFRRGAFVVAYKTGAAVVPISITGSFHIIPKGKLKINPSKVKVSIGQPLRFKKQENVDPATLWKSAQEVRNVIAELIKRDRAISC